MASLNPESITSDTLKMPQQKHKDWIEILRCPITGNDLRELSRDEISEINQKIDDKSCWKRDGSLHSHELEEGFITEDGAYIYPVINGISVLMNEMALTLDRENVDTTGLHDKKQLVKDFYDGKGWSKNEEGHYEDAVIFEDLRDVSAEYLRKCHSRLGRYIPASGKYMLDAASGPIQFDDYLQYSEKYTYRICVDLSLQALTEARKKLGDKGIYLLCDMTNLPIKKGAVDGFLSINTIYHIPKEEQLKAMQELYRVLSPGGKGAIVYEWYKYSPWMNFWLLPVRGFNYFRNKLRKMSPSIKGSGSGLYYFVYPYEYLRDNLGIPFKVGVWRTVSVDWMKMYIHKGLFGRQVLDWLYKQEEKSPEKYGRKGEYPILAFEKPDA